MLLRHGRGARRTFVVVAMLLAATLDLWVRRPKVGAEGAVWIHGWCRRILLALGVDFEISGTMPASGAVVSNHLSYLDILAFSAARPFIMVAKSEVRAWPLLGRLTARAGTVYVDREGGPATYAAVNEAMVAAFRSGLPVLFFPEGTTTDGSGVLPFRRGLFHSVLNNAASTHAAAICYTLGEGNGQATVGETVCWCGDALFGPHLFRCLGLCKLSVKIAFSPSRICGLDRFQLSENSRQHVVSTYARLSTDVILNLAAGNLSGRENVPAYVDINRNVKPCSHSPGIC